MATLSESSDSESEFSRPCFKSWSKEDLPQQQTENYANDCDDDQNLESDDEINSLGFKGFKRKYDSEDENESSKKRKRQEQNMASAPSGYNPIVKNMMKNMGFKEGSGLGKYGQGRTQIVEASKQRGRRGFGLHLDGLEPADIQWDFSKEKVNIQEDVYWMPQCFRDPPKIHELRQWMKEGPKKLVIDDEDEFCDPGILRNVLACKSVFDKLEPEEMRRARTRSNPFETIRGVIFQNRAAVKMANIDAMFDFMFTDPKDSDGNSILEPHELLYFADICAGPGGFSEYVLWRKKWEAKGFGFTLRGQNDFKLEEFFAGPPESFEPHYGVNGLEGDGDIYVSENLREFRRFVLENTDGKGVHFVMADGGFSVEGRENLQEILSKRLYLCQFLCALSILRTGGHFICKLFDVFTPFSVGLIYLVYHAFQHICIHKPNTSRPANSERYIICKNRLENTKDIHDYLYEVNCRLGQLSSSLCNQDIVEIVPLRLLKEDAAFYDYIVESNNRLGEQQIIHLAKIKAFAQNT
ncbi:cap-specific mRNA (nucleoside-2'-O-)-methyltransferase 1 isoform X1 [Centruroides vittatus]|uniref:cap-specific mRNA (nucleoside-2'-O-)-methyltransferase 1 isoform X1 n=2 Tax=Centruroides vittatus TaxID=120091 RepID=UPI0035109FC1